MEVLMKGISHPSETYDLYDPYDSFDIYDPYYTHD